MKKKPKLHWIYSIPMQNYLGERGILPVQEDQISNAAGYVRSEELRAATGSYYIERYLFKNKQ